MMWKNLLSHPLARGQRLEDQGALETRRIIREKAFLRRIYEEWYAAIAARLGRTGGVILELGSGSGFLKSVLPGAITSEVVECSHVDVVLDGCRLPLGEGTLGAIVMTDVFHHLPKPGDFLREAARCIVPGGRILMVEPWVTPWSSFVFRNFHHEPFREDAAEWEFDSSDPLADASGALPWIVFSRDRERFEEEFSQWRIGEIRPFMPFRYLLSGGVSLRSFMPGWSYGFWAAIEKGLGPLMGTLAMFALIELVRTGEGPTK